MVSQKGGGGDAEVGHTGVQVSCFLSLCVCARLDSVGMRVRKKVADAPESSLRACVSDGEDTRDEGASVACSPELNHGGKLVLVPFSFFVVFFVCLFVVPFHIFFFASLLREGRTSLNFGIHFFTISCLDPGWKKIEIPARQRNHAASVWEPQP